MFELFIEGGWMFMLLITLLGLCMLFFAIKAAMAIYGNKVAYPTTRLYYVRFFGMLALVTGVLGQLIGLYEGMKMLSQMGEISQAMLAGGLRVSSITTLYGFIIFLLAHLFWFLLDIKLKRTTHST